MSPLTTALLSSGVIAALIVGIFNIVAVTSNKRQLHRLELMKNKMGLMKFRYESLYNLSAELNGLPDVYYDFVTKKDNENS